jgi:hypothetical protein
MSSFRTILLAAMIAGSVSPAAFAQTKADAGSGPTSGATTTNDAGSGPTKGATQDQDSTASNAPGSTENSAGVSPGPKSTGGSQPVTPAMPEKK